MKYYFAYGSNMNKKQMQERCGSGARFLGKAHLPGYKFVYDGYSQNWKGAVANIVPSEDEVVWGVLYEVSEDCEKNLDKYEGLGTAYQKKRVFVYDDLGTAYEAFVYLREPQEPGKPSEDYVKTVVEGAREAGIPEDYIKKYLEIN